MTERSVETKVNALKARHAEQLREHKTDWELAVLCNNQYDEAFTLARDLENALLREKARADAHINTQEDMRCEIAELRDEIMRLTGSNSGMTAAERAALSQSSSKEGDE